MAYSQNGAVIGNCEDPREDWPPRGSCLGGLVACCETVAPCEDRRHDERYFKELEIDVKLVFRVVPRPFTTAMIASEMPAAIKPYSMAVAPDSSEKNLRM